MISYLEVKVKNEVFILENDTNNIFDKRLIVLFLLKETKSMLTIEQMAKLCNELEDVTYIDICGYVESLLSSRYIVEKIQDNKKYYELTITGENILNELIELVPGINWLNIKKTLREQMEGYSKNYEIGTRIIPVHGDEMKVSCYIRDNSDELINLTIFAGDKENAKRISQHWSQNADDIYMKIIELMS